MRCGNAGDGHDPFRDASMPGNVRANRWGQGWRCDEKEEDEKSSCAFPGGTFRVVEACHCRPPLDGITLSTLLVVCRQHQIQSKACNISTSRCNGNRDNLEIIWGYFSLTACVEDKFQVRVRKTYILQNSRL